MKKKMGQYKLLNETIKYLDWNPKRIRSLYEDLEFGLRFWRTEELTEDFCKNIKSTAKRSNSKKDLSLLVSEFKKELYKDIEKVDTLWDITWNVNPENVVRYIRSWYFNNITYYYNEELEVVNPFIDFSINEIIWIQYGLANDNCQKFANEICAIIKNADAWLTYDISADNFHEHINARMEFVKENLVDEYGLGIIDYIHKLTKNAETRNSGDIKQVNDNLLKYLSEEERRLNQKIYLEKYEKETLNKDYEVQLIRINANKIEEKLNAAVKSQSEFTRNFGPDISVKLAEINQMTQDQVKLEIKKSEDDFISLEDFIEKTQKLPSLEQMKLNEDIVNNLKTEKILSEIENEYQKRGFDLEFILNRERRIRVPRFKIQKNQLAKLLEEKINDIIDDKKN
ncbi:MAG: hypothetical protein ACRCW6_01215 [Mycoplasmoidaceae bacterium]